jgi:hypothetical protein
LEQQNKNFKNNNKNPENEQLPTLISPPILFEENRGISQQKQGF